MSALVAHVLSEMSPLAGARSRYHTDPLCPSRARSAPSSRGLSCPPSGTRRVLTCVRKFVVARGAAASAGGATSISASPATEKGEVAAQPHTSCGPERRARLSRLPPHIGRKLVSRIHLMRNLRAYTRRVGASTQSCERTFHRRNATRVRDSGTIGPVVKRRVFRGSALSGLLLTVGLTSALGSAPERAPARALGHVARRRRADRAQPVPRRPLRSLSPGRRLDDPARSA